MTKIRTYKMTHATGFAPNISGGVLTLAACKPGIREHAQIGEWHPIIHTCREVHGDSAIHRL
ncbi:MAG: hypothetical protein LBP75_04920 [Planctomycetota bacterium]|nr:hypothetical protein [Planctomycetota bacterium]